LKWEEFFKREERKNKTKDDNKNPQTKPSLIPSFPPPKKESPFPINTIPSSLNLPRRSLFPAMSKTPETETTKI